MTEHIIDRAKWVCGGMSLASALGSPKLLNERGRQCCLGQICSQHGYSNAELDDRATPGSLASIAKLPDWLRPDPFAVANDMMFINDDPNLCQEARERTLIDYAAKVDVKLSFTGVLL